MLKNINSLAELHNLVTELNKDDNTNKILVNSLHIGEISGKTPTTIINSTITRVKQEEINYTTTLGNSYLRQLIANDLNIRKGFFINQDNIILTNGSKQGLFYAIQMLINKDDEVIIHTPYWNSYESLVSMKEGKLITLPLEKNGNLNLELLATLITKKTKMLILCSPHNPTGSYPDKDNLIKLLELLKETNIVVLSDEIYERIDFLKQHCSIASLVNECQYKTDILTVGGFSKSHMMTGYRIGYLIASPALIEKSRLLQANICTCACSLSQYVAIDALQDTSIVDNLNKYLANRLTILNPIFKDYPMWTVKGAFYLFINITRKLVSNETDLDICERLLENKVAVAPGSFFNMKNYIRISYACSEDMFVRSVPILKHFFEK